MVINMVTAERLRELFSYDPDAGHFIRKITVSNNARKGDLAGCLTKGRVVIRIDDKLYGAHRLAWLYMTGAWPKGEIDHIDGNPSNNAGVNLRDVSHAMNQQNIVRAKKGNLSKFLGVTKVGNRWKSRIRVGNEQKHLGYFDTPEAAHEAYLGAKRRLHAGCTI